MAIEQRRSERIDDFIPLEIRVVHASDGQELAGPFSGRIIDISDHGVCLLMTQIMVRAFHVFHSTRDAEDAVLQLVIDQPPEFGRHVLTARPVWMHLFRQDEIRAFKMGVEFAETPEVEQMRESLADLCKDRETRSAWWQQHSQARDS
ncbi:PilZ domain-containing protein [Desulfobulbus sp.]|uniref:PilZ domain-containing protein n=1 Tax=Desulfobulbus sp. TaxID=895 RepID=UPI00286EF113|nr:PilZ domain-containing protein [Desulfobulbus sp.]